MVDQIDLGQVGLVYFEKVTGMGWLYISGSQIKSGWILISLTFQKFTSSWVR